MNTRLKTSRFPLLTLATIYMLMLSVQRFVTWRSGIWRGEIWRGGPRRLTNHWLWRFAAMIGVWVYAPLAVLLTLSSALRNGRTAAMLMGPLLLFAADYGRLFVPRRLRSQPRAAQRVLNSGKSTTLRVMTWNVLKYNTNVEPLVAAVARLQPDVIALQENRAALSTALAERLCAAYPHQAIHPNEGASGMAIFSRYPLCNAQTPDFYRLQSCNCQQVTLDLGGRLVPFINAHPWAPNFEMWQIGPMPIVTNFDTRNQNPIFYHLLKRIDAIQKRQRPGSSALLVAGDFNTTEGQSNYHRLCRRLRNTFAEAGWGLGLTWPLRRHDGAVHSPLLRIDHIFHGDAWLARRCWTDVIDGSDHCCLIADLVLTE